MALAGVVGTVDVPPGTVEAFGKWPVTIALIGLAAFAIYMSDRKSDKDRKSLDNLADHFAEIAANLAQRPCVRNPKND